MTAERPSSIPDGLVVELSRARVLPGAGAEADRWMRRPGGPKDRRWVEAEPQVLLTPAG